MSTESKSVILAESSRLVGQIGNSIVLDLYARIREIEALTHSLAATVEKLPKSEALFKQIVPAIVDAQGDVTIAGGGVWPEPYAFSPNCERCSFFWGRNAEGELEYYDGYNQLDSGYHQEAWYAVGRYATSGHCIWSASYADLYSSQPMISCTAPTFAAGRFSGVVTINISLEGLQALTETWRKRSGGYIFILDRNNRFITFPDLQRVTAVQQTQSSRTAVTFLAASELAEQQPLFAPVVSALQAMNAAMLNQAKEMPSYQFEIAKRLPKESYQIDTSEAELIAAVMADPLATLNSVTEESPSSFLYQTFEIDKDFFVKEPSTVFLFHVPKTYLKVVVVKPFSEAAMATYSIVQSEKMSSLGQLVAGLAHEVNNPINFIYGNLTFADAYARDLVKLVKLYQQYYPAPPAVIQNYTDAIDFDFLLTDFAKILASMRVGADRIRQLVLSLRNFARLDEASLKSVNIHIGLENTLLLLDSRLQSRPDYPGIQLTKQYGDLPLVECYPGSLNQVFMNILINAMDALEARHRSNDESSPPPALHIQTERVEADDSEEDTVSPRVAIRIIDNGSGIPESIQQRLFDPFFTTKPVGKGTGLGLAISYQIVTEKHGGKLRCTSTPGQGTEFYIELPVRQPQH